AWSWLSAETVRGARPRTAAMWQGRQDLGWTEGRTLRIDYRWNAAEHGRALALANELAATSPDLIVACGGPATAALAQATRSMPIVFVQVIDPIALGIVTSL